MTIKGKRYYIKWSYVNRVCRKGVALFGFAVMCGAIGAMIQTGQANSYLLRCAISGLLVSGLWVLPTEGKR